MQQRFGRQLLIRLNKLCFIFVYLSDLKFSRYVAGGCCLMKNGMNLHEFFELHELKQIVLSWSARFGADK